MTPVVPVSGFQHMPGMTTLPRMGIIAPMRIICFLALAGTLAGPAAIYTFAKEEPEKPCKVYFTVIEHDEQTSNLNMIGLNGPQREWFAKHGAKEAPNICLVNGNATGQRVTVETGDEGYIQKTVGELPFYSISWEEHRVFVPDHDGGHMAYTASGILSIWKKSANAGNGDFVPISPIHSTNHTIFSSSSTSLLKDALKEIRTRNSAN